MLNRIALLDDSQSHKAEAVTLGCRHEDVVGSCTQHATKGGMPCTLVAPWSLCFEWVKCSLGSRLRPCPSVRTADPIPISLPRAASCVAGVACSRCARGGVVDRSGTSGGGAVGSGRLTSHHVRTGTARDVSYSNAVAPGGPDRGQGSRSTGV